MDPERTLVLIEFTLVVEVVKTFTFDSDQDFSWDVFVVVVVVMMVHLYLKNILFVVDLDCFLITLMSHYIEYRSFHKINLINA